MKSIHSNTKDQICDICHKALPNESQLFVHKLQAHEGKIKMVECNLCGKSMKSSNLKYHHRKAHEEGKNNFKCDTCEESYKTNVYLKMHIRNVHKNVEKDLKYPCEHCDKSFENPGKCESHIKRVHRNVTKTCTICKKEFSAKYLKQHIKIFHDKVETHQCDLCQKVFYTNYHLKYHTDRVHSTIEKEYNYTCSVCDEKYRNESSLQLKLSMKT